MRSRPFVVSTMGSVTAQPYNVSCYACYHKLYLPTFVVSTMGSATAQHYNVSFYACYHKFYLHTFVVSTMGSATAQHYNVSFYACYHKFYLPTFVVSTMGSATPQHYNVSYMLWRGGCCVGVATCSIFWVWRLFPGPSQWSLLPIVSSWRRTVGFLEPMLSKFLVGFELQDLLVQWGPDWADNLKTQIQGRCGYHILTWAGSRLPGLNWYKEFVYPPGN